MQACETMRHKASGSLIVWVLAMLVGGGAALVPGTAEALSGELTTLLNSTGRNLKANQSGKNCEPQVFAEVGVALEHVSRSLGDLFFDGDVSEKHERYAGTITPHDAAGGGVQASRCTGDFSALWLIKPGHQADAGNIHIYANLNSCACATSTDLKKGYLQFVVPVIRSKSYDGSESLDVGAPHDFIIDYECCDGSRQGRTGAEEAPSTATRVNAEPPWPRTAPPPPRPPVKAPEPPKPQPVTPQWSMDNPCPPCQSWKDYLDRTLVEIARLEAENRALENELADLENGIGRKQKEISNLRDDIKLQEGTGGSASNYPLPGWKTDSVTQADGRVKVTVTDASGRIVEERYRERTDLARMRKKIEDLEAEIRQDRQKQEQLKQRRDANQRGIEAKKQQAEAYRKGLEECIREKCSVQPQTPAYHRMESPLPQPIEPSQQTEPAKPMHQAEPVKPMQPAEPPKPVQQTEPARPVQPSRPATCGIESSKPIVVGPKSEVGTGAAKVVEEAASGFLGGLLGKATGGILGGGGGDAEGPPLSKDPIPDSEKKTFQVNDQLKMRVGAHLDPEGKQVLISATILEVPGKGTFQAVGYKFLPLPDHIAQTSDCAWQPADQYFWYKLWLEWSLSVSWSRDHFVDGQRVSHEEGSFAKSGVKDLASGTVKIPGTPEFGATLWQQAGFPRATSGVQSMGFAIPLESTKLESGVAQIVIQVTNPTVDPVVTIPVDLILMMGDQQNVLGDTGEAKDKIPILGGIPVLGEAFRDKQTEDKRPLLILIKPTLVPVNE